MPWYDSQLASNDPELKKPQDSREFIMSKVIEDLDFAIQYLPAKKELYKVTKWTALALKSRASLFEGTFRKYHELTVDGVGYEYYLEESIKASEAFMTQSGLEATGKGFELHPLTHPSDVVAKENARFKFTFDGEPLANLDIEITPHGTAWRNSRNPMNLKTDKNGVVTFKPTVVGPHLLMTSMRKDINSPLADAAGVNYHLTFEVLPQ